jgi:hypothetical protein
MVVLIGTFFICHSFRLRVWLSTTNSEMGHLRTGINCAISLMGQQPLESCGTPVHNPLLPLHSDRHVNISPAIVDLCEPHPCPRQVSRDKGKGKRHASPMQSSRSNKHSTSSADVFELVTERLSFLHNDYEKKCNVNDSGHSHASAPAPAPAPVPEPPMPNHLRKRPWTESTNLFRMRWRCL